MHRHRILLIVLSALAIGCTADRGAAATAGTSGAGAQAGAAAGGQGGAATGMGGGGGVPAPTRVLFIGNSYTSVNGLPSVLAELGNFDVGEHAPGGTTWLDHDTNPDVDQLIAEGWDYVVLQNQSQQPWLFPGDVDPSLPSLDAKIKAAGAQTVLFMTWSRDDAATRFEQDMAVSHYYERHAAEIGATVAPVGRAWERAKRDSTITLHAGDGSHPNEVGTYLAACVFYATLTGTSPEGVGDGGLGVSVQEQSYLQTVAWATLRARQHAASPEVASWPLSTDAIAHDLVPSPALSLGDTGGNATQFGPEHFAGIPYFPGLNAAQMTVAFRAHRQDWSALVNGVEVYLSKPWGYTLAQSGVTLTASLYTDGAVDFAVLNHSVAGLAPGWHDFAMTYDGATYALWVDTVQLGAAPADGGIRYYATSPDKSRYDAIALGALPVDTALIGGAPGQFFTGAMSDVRLFDRALSQTELENL